MNFLSNLLRPHRAPKPSIDEAIAGITDSILMLDEVARIEEARTERLREEHERIRVEITESIGRSARAAAIAERLTALVE